MVIISRHKVTFKKQLYEKVDKEKNMKNTREISLISEKIFQVMHTSSHTP